jgi:hypothetical protein
VAAAADRDDEDNRACTTRKPASISRDGEVWDGGPDIFHPDRDEVATTTGSRN